MYQLKKSVAMLIACLLLLSSGLFAFAEDTGNRHSDIMDVVFPSDISFDIVVVPAPYEGFVTSKEFKIINNGDEAVAVRLYAAQLTFSDEVHFAVSDTAQLPQTGNNMFAELICISDETQETLPLKNEPGDEEYIYYLESGDAGIFKITGAVNEAGEVPWSENKVTVSVCYSMGNDEAALEAALEEAKAEANAEAEEAEEAQESESAKPESLEAEAGSGDIGDAIVEDIVATAPTEDSDLLEVVLETSKVEEQEENPEADEEQEPVETESAPEPEAEQEESETAAPEE